MLGTSIPDNDMVTTEPFTLQPRHIAPCGMNCALCLAFQRPKDKCSGCREEDDHRPSCRRSCIIRNCPTVQSSISHLCYECEKMPCRRLKQLDARYRTKYGMSMIANLTEIRDKGMDVFLAHQVERYTCPTCQGLLCVHRSHCLSCEQRAAQERRGRPSPKG